MNDEMKDLVPVPWLKDWTQKEAEDLNQLVDNFLSGKRPEDTEYNRKLFAKYFSLSPAVTNFELIKAVEDMFQERSQ